MRLFQPLYKLHTNKGRIEDLQIKAECSSENREKNQIALNFRLKKLQEYTK